jgi:hypothetical protein
LLDLLSLHRNSSGVPFATVIQKLAASERERYESTRFHSEVRRFSGNLLGGEISGESPKLLLDHDRAIDANPFVALCLSLFREAQDEIDLDFAYFRYWNLLEVVAFDRVEDASSVTDFNGSELREGRRKATTDRPQGRVYEMLKRYMRSRKFIEEHFGQDLPEGLWDAVGVLYACRNATAHYGKFRADDPAQQRRPWYSMARKAYDAGMVRGGHVSSEPYFGNLQSAATNMVRMVLSSESLNRRT